MAAGENKVGLIGFVASLSSTLTDRVGELSAPFATWMASGMRTPQ
jgi:hypothetical protein